MVELPFGYEVISDQAKVDAVAAHQYLTRSYWSPGIPLATVAKALSNSLCVAIRFEDRQVAMARVVTDQATFAYLADVYVLEDHRGRGLSKAMVAHLHGLPELAGLRRWLLMTRDAHDLYRQHGWTPLANPNFAMERHIPDPYR